MPQESHLAAPVAPVSVRAVLPEAQLVPPADLQIQAVTEHSSRCVPGCLFAAIPGTRTNGAAYLADALQRGAVGVLVDSLQANLTVPQCVVPNVREAYARMCAALRGNPSRRVQVAGVTGTNGKTTVTWLVQAMARAAGWRCGLLGTVGYHDGVETAPSSLTTPDAETFTDWLSRMAEQNTTHAAVELSSHALHQGRVAGTELSAAAITNITQDHFDYHQTFANYQASKARMLSLIRPGGIAALNQDDPGCWELAVQVPSQIRLISYSWRQPADVSAQILSESLSGMQFRLTIDGQTQVCDSRLIGRHNIENCLAAAAIGHAWGIGLAELATAIREFRGAPGRLERIRCGQRFEVFVDYAHTDDALRRCLQALRSVTPGRIVCVFGAGGDRDRTKRPKLGAAAQLADVPIVTSDNPRSELPEQIAADIVAGFSSDGPAPVVELDRAQAIRRAVRLAAPGDCVLIAGKGHENEQIFRDHRIPFDDRREAQQAIRELLAEPAARLRRGA